MLAGYRFEAQPQWIHRLILSIVSCVLTSKRLVYLYNPAPVPSLLLRARTNSQSPMRGIFRPRRATHPHGPDIDTEVYDDQEGVSRGQWTSRHPHVTLDELAARDCRQSVRFVAVDTQDTEIKT